MKYGADLWQWFRLEIKLNVFVNQPYHKTIHHQFIRNTTRVQSGPDAFDKSRFLVTFSSILGTINNFTSSDAEDNTSMLLNRGGIADLPLLRTLLAICQKSREPSFLEWWTLVLLAYARLAVSRTFLHISGCWWGDKGWVLSHSLFFYLWFCLLLSHVLSHFLSE